MGKYATVVRCDKLDCRACRPPKTRGEKGTCGALALPFEGDCPFYKTSKEYEIQLKEIELRKLQREVR